MASILHVGRMSNLKISLKSMDSCSEGLVFVDNVTISRDVMIRPSIYYGNDLGKGPCDR